MNEKPQSIRDIPRLTDEKRREIEVDYGYGAATNSNTSWYTQDIRILLNEIDELKKELDTAQQKLSGLFPVVIPPWTPDGS